MARSKKPTVIEIFNVIGVDVLPYTDDEGNERKELIAVAGDFESRCGKCGRTVWKHEHHNYCYECGTPLIWGKGFTTKEAEQEAINKGIIDIAKYYGLEIRSEVPVKKLYELLSVKEKISHAD